MNQHLCDYNESERTDYMVVVASIAGADGELTSEEVLALRELCLHFVLGPQARGRVMAATSAPPEELDQVVGALTDSAMRYSLLLDLGTMAFQDGTLSPPEEAEIHRLGAQLGILAEQRAAILRFAESVHKGEEADLESALARLEKSGVPLPAVSLSATLHGLAKTGRSPVLEALVPLR